LALIGSVSIRCERGFSIWDSLDKPTLLAASDILMQPVPPKPKQNRLTQTAGDQEQPMVNKSIRLP
jgi:hypothetical protein